MPGVSELQTTRRTYTIAHRTRSLPITKHHQEKNAGNQPPETIWMVENEKGEHATWTHHPLNQSTPMGPQCITTATSRSNKSSHFTNANAAAHWMCKTQMMQHNGTIQDDRHWNTWKHQTSGIRKMQCCNSSETRFDKTKPACKRIKLTRTRFNKTSKADRKRTTHTKPLSVVSVWPLPSDAPSPVP